VKKENLSGNAELKDAVYKKAVGFRSEEVVEEFSPDGESGDMKLVKRKVTQKYNPPDLTAALRLLDERADDFAAMTDARLQRERRRLLCELNRQVKGGGDGASKK
jgi:hypothetical protein